MKAVIKLDVPDWQIGQDVSVYFPDTMCKRGKCEAEEPIDIRDVAGLWCDDITFCPGKCGWTDCPRNQQNIRDKTIPHSFSVEIPNDCPKKLRKGDSDDNQGLR